MSFLALYRDRLVHAQVIVRDVVASLDHDIVRQWVRYEIDLRSADRIWSVDR